ncbi:hypothetical protein BDN72DRAFT_897649 [Pluteus cervinus]|uniref:Uncharacterized protein n=1 Tax=Pluteus cervinus TaxID=181527 RepID=A0ACD3ATX8_9AGAR|nr:hypothetical protein BDN72DRAFT_897649 [Pluteus cervinus]
MAMTTFTSTSKPMEVSIPLHHSVPTEITSLIFVFEIQNGRDPTELALVCKDWKDITYGTRALWTHFSFDLKTTSVSRAYRWFHLSQPLPFSLEISAGYDTCVVLPTELTPLIHSITPRLINLSFHGSQSAIVQFFKALPPLLPLLHELCLEGQGSADWNTFYPKVEIDLPSLRSLSLSSCFYPGFCRLFPSIIPWSKLTNLEIVWPQASMPNLLIYILECHNLIKCRLDLPFTTADFTVLPHKEYHLPHLRSLHLKLCNTGVIQLLDYVHLPALTELELSSTYCHFCPKQIQKLIALYERCPFALESLALNQLTLDVGLCIEFTSKFRTLTSIRVDGSDSFR